MDGATLEARGGSTGPVASGDEAADALVGRTLERRYRLDELVGQGGMAFVFRGTHTLIGKRLAVKVLRPELNRDPDVVQRFLREAQVVSSIKHANVIDISDYGQTDDGGAFYVMEFLRGTTLAQRIDEGLGALPPDVAVGIALQICQGLSAAHDQGVVHRDLKPENVFLCAPKKEGAEATVKLLDFGIARAGHRITVAGAVLGTPEYMSPEQAMGRDVDLRADLYSLGVMLFEMLTGLVPFRSDDVAITMQSHVHASPPSLLSVDPQLAYLARTEEVLGRLLAKSPDQRPEDAATVAEALAQAMDADLGSETAERVVRATLAIGSGGIGKPDGKLKATSPNWGGRMGWNGPEAPPPAAPVLADPIDTTHELPPPRRSGIGWVMGGAAVLAATVTIGTYAAIGGFDATTPPTEAASTLASAPGAKSTDAIPERSAAPTPAQPQLDPPAATVAARVEGGHPQIAGPGAPEVDVSPTPTSIAEPTHDVGSPSTAPIKPKRKPLVGRTKEKPKSGSPQAAGTDQPSPSSPGQGNAHAPAETDPVPPTAPSEPANTKSKPKPAGPPVGDLKDPFGRK